MKKMLIFFLWMVKLYSYDIEIYSKEEIFFEKDILEYKIIEIPKNSVFNIKQKSSNSFEFDSSDLGQYKIAFTSISGEVIEEVINVIGKNYTLQDIEVLFKSNKIYDCIREIYLYSSDNIQSQKLIYQYLLTKSAEKENIDYILNVFSTSKLFIKNFEFEQENFLEQLFLNKKEMGDVRAEVLILNLLKEYNSYYAFLYGKYCLENGKKKEKGVLELKKLVDENLDKEASKLLGKYYLDRGNIEGEKYLYFGDREEFFKYIFQKDNREEFEYYLNKLDDKEKESILKLKSEFDKTKIISIYLQKGNLNREQMRYDLAKEYYDKVVEFSTNDSQIKEALFNLGKISVLEEKYEKGLEIFGTYLEKYDGIEEVEALFYLGLCNFKLKNIEKSDIIFNRIKKTYKYSIWDEKIKILLKEIE